MSSEVIRNAILIITLLAVFVIIYKTAVGASASGKGAALQRPIGTSAQIAPQQAAYPSVAGGDLSMSESAVVGCRRGYASLQGCNKTVFDMAWVVGKDKVVVDSMRRVEYCGNAGAKPCDAVLYDTAAQTSVRVSRRVMWIDRSAYFDDAVLSQHAAFIARQPRTRGGAAQVSEIGGTRVFYVVL